MTHIEMTELLAARLIGATLMSIAIFIAAIKRNARVALALIVISMALFYLLAKA
ncbi:MAG: hypothetical protein QME12_00330 [Nanoarchaeota archaeon]|nr:hypothetical protein [Nanoarchaeota archaeon]